MNLRGVLSGSLALVALQVIVTSPQTGRLAELLALPAAWARKLIDPNVPAIGDHRGAKPAATAAPTAAAPRSTTTPPGAFDWSTVTI